MASDAEGISLLALQLHVLGRGQVRQVAALRRRKSGWALHGL